MPHPPSSRRRSVTGRPRPSSTVSLASAASAAMSGRRLRKPLKVIRTGPGHASQMNLRDASRCPARAPPCGMTPRSSRAIPEVASIAPPMTPTSADAPSGPGRSVDTSASRQDQPGPTPSAKPGAEHERPVAHRDERLARSVTSEAAFATVGPGWRRVTTVRRLMTPTAMTAAFEQPRGHEAEGEALVLPLDQREQRDGAADVGEDETRSRKAPRQHPGVGAGADDVGGIVQDGP